LTKHVRNIRRTPSIRNIHAFVSGNEQAAAHHTRKSPPESFRATFRLQQSSYNQFVRSISVSTVTFHQHSGVGVSPCLYVKVAAEYL
jgi:hypothetical protein